MTKVVNLYKEPYDIYIGRAGKGKDGYWGNPISVGKICSVCGKTHLEGGSTLVCYKRYLVNRCNNDSEFKRKLLDLDGKILGCFCKPKKCHGDEMINFINEMLGE